MNVVDFAFHQRKFSIHCFVAVSEIVVQVDEIVGNGKLHTVNARAVEDATILQIPVALMRSLSTSVDHLGLKLLASLSKRLQTSQLDVEHRSAMSATQIVACYLQELCVLYGFNPSGFDLPYSKTLIASRLRMELETFSRTLKNLRSRGIEVDGTHVRFTSLSEVAQFVCASCSESETCPTRQTLQRLADQSPVASLPRVLRKSL